ncbi:metal-dependent hydrolase family protein [Xanthocytophaga flava]|uniref:metal-dependent hydrolase family protein n=1 Tax=Xanthocytophaga flava TaxID=3048013 RepID=UPI0028D4033B|nr:amidohydrolase family protein [Xanthocytophaga flavus]MDJ1470526.1 amidohydrolase family protein [Xanthocytophaga flavus]
MKKILYSAALFAWATCAFAQKTLLHCGTLIDGVRNDTQTQMTLVVEGKKIIRIDKGYTNPAADEKVVDLKNKTVMPGFTDMHVHLESETSKDQYLKRMSYGQADIAFEAQKHAMTTLMAGFTTVRDLGGSGVNISLRNAINKGLVVGPRIFTSGKTIATTGGHGDPTNGWRSDIQFPTATSDGVVDSPDAARQAIRQRYKDGVDCIKITATGGVLSIAKSGKAPQFMEDELDAIVKTAKDYGFHVAAHAHGAEGMKRAIKAGITTIEHGTFMDDETIELFKKYGTYYVPTIIAGKTVADSAKVPGYYHPLVIPKAIETGKQIQATFAKAYKAGVKIAFGTDAGVFLHGKNAKEFEYMVEAGMPAMQAIKCATIIPAEILGMKDQLGSLESGKFADIVATNENPLQNIKTLQNVTFVMKEGVVYKNQ